MTEIQHATKIAARRRACSDWTLYNTRYILNWIMLAGVFAIGASCRPPAVSTGLELQSEDYAKARSQFHTHLVRHAPSPQKSELVQITTNATEVEYAPSRHLKAWITHDTPDNRKMPAVLFLHGGFAFGADDWEMTKPYRDSGYVVMMPILRGENGQSGDYSMFYDEVDDVLAAAEYLAARRNVDPKHMYVAGHSVGGTLTLLAAMSTTRFRAAASFSGSPDQVAWSSSQPQLIPFNPSDIHEFQMRSPIAYATSFKCPVRILYGSQEALFAAPSQKTASLAKAKNLDVEAISVPGDHFTAVPAEIEQSIQFFRLK